MLSISKQWGWTVGPPKLLAADNCIVWYSPFGAHPPPPWCTICTAATHSTILHIALLHWSSTQGPRHTICSALFSTALVHSIAVLPRCTIMQKCHIAIAVSQYYSVHLGPRYTKCSEFCKLCDMQCILQCSALVHLGPRFTKYSVFCTICNMQSILHSIIFFAVQHSSASGAQMHKIKCILHNMPNLVYFAQYAKCSVFCSAAL